MYLQSNNKRLKTNNVTHSLVREWFFVRKNNTKLKLYRSFPYGVYLLTSGACTVEWALWPHPATSASKPMHPPWRGPKPARGQFRPPGSTPPSALATFLVVSPAPPPTRRVSTGKNPVGRVVWGKPSYVAKHRRLTLENQL